MTWSVALDRSRIDLYTIGRITADDAQRQIVTVEEILRRLNDLPGLVLADEVGMGKTFVALAVAVSVAWARPEADPVVVMVPPSLKDKWPRDFQVFRVKCVKRPGDRAETNLRAGFADTGLDFFRLLDNPKSRRCHLIFLSHGALARGLSDPWTKLAIIQSALRVPALAEQRRVFHRFAGVLLQMGGRFPDETMFRRLLDAPTLEWRAILRAYQEHLDDDPVPKSISEILAKGGIHLVPLREQLHALPLRWSEYLGERITDVRRALKAPLAEVWQRLLGEARFQSPLLVLDEAHHLKNPDTQLASLFVAPEAVEEAALLEGALKDRFERMLFLTATPFQLGHRELLNVLDRFRGIRWQAESPALRLREFVSRMEQLSRALDQAQYMAAALDAKWGKLTPELIGTGADNLDQWWASVLANPTAHSEKVQTVRHAYQTAQQRLTEAEELLRPWVIRHMRSRKLPGSNEPRRRVLRGAAIAGIEPIDEGLPVDDGALLSFLLAARCEAALNARSTETLLRRTGRTVFAEGLASSYEAYLDTRRLARDRNGDALMDDAAPVDDRAQDGQQRAEWYLNCLQRTLPDASSFQEHPKIRATVNEAIRLWKAGEKVLVFCHFRRTGRSLRAHISAALDAHIMTVAAKQLGCDVRRVNQELEAVGRQFDAGRRWNRELSAFVREGLDEYTELSAQDRERIEEVVRRFARTPSFLVRYFPLAKRRGAALREAFEHPDESGVSLAVKLRRFAEFIARRCESAERHEYLSALDDINTGLRYSREQEVDAGQKRLLPNVRLANGEVPAADRRRLLLAFNAPFFPEILIASSVLAEGVDLHLDCRYVIHHDLCWNPSTLEQRTGRVDRIGCKAEQVTKPIGVYLPFLGGTQDEKMYRVVRDRERWFQVVMGEKYALDELGLERLANRLPLPESAARELTLKLEVYRGP
jgi:hypothetical protein